MATIPLGSVAPSLGRALGTGISDSLQRGLDQLAQQKMASLAQQNMQRGLTPFVGDQLAQILTNLDPESRKAAMNNLEGLYSLVNMNNQQQPQASFMEQISTPEGQLTEQVSEQPFNAQGLQKQLDFMSTLKSMGIPTEQVFEALKQNFQPGVPAQSQQQPQQQQPQQAQQIQQAPQGLSDQQRAISDLFKSPELKRRQEELDLKKREADSKIETKKQLAVDKANAPFLGQLEKGIPIAEEMFDKASEMYNLLQSGRVDAGISGKLLPNVLQNADSQRFLALSNDIATILASNSGVATNFKIKFAQERKPNLSQNPQTQKALTEDIMKQAQKVLVRAKIKDDLIAENNYNQPPNLRSQVDQQYKVYQKEVESLGNPSEHAEGTVAINDATGNRFVKRFGIWMKE